MTEIYCKSNDCFYNYLNLCSKLNIQLNADKVCMCYNNTNEKIKECKYFKKCFKSR